MNFEFDHSRKAHRQGDVYLVPIIAIPQEAIEIHAEDGNFIITHSKTGHHHVIAERDDIRQFSGMDILRGFLEIKNEPADLVHLRNHHTHATQTISPGAWLIQRQGRPTPSGWKKAID